MEGEQHELFWLRKTRNRMVEVLGVAGEQARDEALWAVYPDGTQSISEAYLQQELRRLHRVIEEGV